MVYVFVEKNQKQKIYFLSNRPIYSPLSVSLCLNCWNRYLSDVLEYLAAEVR